MLELHIDKLDLNLKWSPSKLSIECKEAQPLNNENTRRQLVIIKTCRTCQKKCKIKVDSECFKNASVVCKDYKAMELKITV